MEKSVVNVLSDICCSMCILRFSGAKLTSFVFSPNEVCSDECSEPKRAKSVAECAACLGLLCRDNLQLVIDKAALCLNEADYDDPIFTITLSLPVCSAVREISVYLHLTQAVAQYAENVAYADVVPAKDVWKQLVNGPIASRVRKRVDNGFFAELQLNVTMSYRGDRRESEGISRLHSLPAASPLQPATRVGVDSVVNSCEHSRLLQLLQVPPQRQVFVTSFAVTCSRASIFLAGRYNKYSRDLYQTPWLICGINSETATAQRAHNSSDHAHLLAAPSSGDSGDSGVPAAAAGDTEHCQMSVLGLIEDHVIAVTRASEVKFSASGREDVDVRTLGRGRPFVLELVNARTSQLSPAELRRLQRRLNSACRGRVRVRDLQLVTRESTSALKEGEEQKRKVYTALVHCVSGAVSDQQLRQLQLRGQRSLQISQQTPLRVLHRRPLATRGRCVHWMRVSRVSDSVFKLNLATQAGTYIKEFVHGDFGRTAPSLASLMVADAPAADASAADASDADASTADPPAADASAADASAADAPAADAPAADASAADASAADASAADASAADAPAADAPAADAPAADAPAADAPAADGGETAAPPVLDIIALDVDSVELDWPPEVE